MDVSDLRQRILRALEAGKNDAALRRSEGDAAAAAFDNFLVNVAVPLLKQAQSILKAEGQSFTVHSPAGSAKLVADGSAQTFLEFVLDSSGNRPHVIGRVSLELDSGEERVHSIEETVGGQVEDAKSTGGLLEPGFGRFLTHEHLARGRKEPCDGLHLTSSEAQSRACRRERQKTSPNGPHPGPWPPLDQRRRRRQDYRRHVVHQQARTMRALVAKHDERQVVQLGVRNDIQA